MFSFSDQTPRKPTLMEAVTAAVFVRLPANMGPEVKAKSPPGFGHIILELPMVSIFKIVIRYQKNAIIWQHFLKICMFKSKVLLKLGY